MLTTLFGFFKHAQTRREIEARLQGLVSPALLERILAEPDCLQRPLKAEMTVLKADLPRLKSSTSDIQGDVRSLARYSELVRGEILRENGLIHFFVGGYCEAYFGAPLAQPEHAARACRAAAASIAAVRKDPMLAKRFGPPSVAVFPGEMVWGPLGPSQAQTRQAVGFANQAAEKMLHTILPGKIILNQDAASAARAGGLEVRDIGAMRLPALTEPLAIFGLSDE